MQNVLYQNVLRSLWVFKFEIGQLVICQPGTSGLGSNKS